MELDLRVESLEERNYVSKKKGAHILWRYGTPITDLGRFTTLLYGISEIVKDDPSMAKLFSAGAVYITSSYLHNIFSNGANRLMHDRLIEKINESI